MIRLACVPFPAPGGPSSTTGPTAHEVFCAIGWPKPPDLNLPDRRRGPPRCSNPFSLENTAPSSPAPSADSTTPRSKTIVVAHDQLRLDLRYGVHGHAHHDQQ